MDVVKSAFPYLVDTSKATGGGEVSSLNFNIIDHNVPFKVEGIEFIPLPVEHGFHADRTPFMSLGFRFGDVSYISDASKIPESTRRKMVGSKTLILDCLRPKPYSSHFGIDQALEECAKINPDHAFFVGMSHSLDHYEFEALLKTRAPSQGSYLAPAYDGLKLTVTKSGEVTSFS
ncbi:hypothetical protein DSO57_1031390 [Entomophthora muscae]|uniref:Uncharacterized protein n=1 Tax=Entomophthora muscae TaxID=34485 RepID=A0ACC2UAG6_9FUNG|nr:hypothetical protein DSO57_1031390 [Entomophthora muscae]